MEYLIGGLIVVGLTALWCGLGLRRITLFEYERGLRYVRGRLDAVLGPGQYYFLPFFTSVVRIDVRPSVVTVPGQELLSADGVALKVSLAGQYEVTDPAIAFHDVQNYTEALYLELQLAIRQIVGTMPVTELLQNREQISTQLQQAVAAKANLIGIQLHSVAVKDIMFPGKLKEIFAQVVAAKQEGLAALERARGETAALRNLANAAKLLDGNPNLLQLRLLQSVSETAGNTLVLDVAPTVAAAATSAATSAATKAPRKSSRSSPAKKSTRKR